MSVSTPYLKSRVVSLVALAYREQRYSIELLSVTNMLASQCDWMTDTEWIEMLDNYDEQLSKIPKPYR